MTLAKPANQLQDLASLRTNLVQGHTDFKRELPAADSGDKFSSNLLKSLIKGYERQITKIAAEMNKIQQKKEG